MKGPVTIAILFFAFVASAQVVPDSLQQKVDGIIETLSVDSLPPLPDTLMAAYHEVEEIRQEFNNTTDSLKGAYEKTLGKINAEIASVNQTIDSLTALRLPTEKYTARIDSLTGTLRETQNRFTSKLGELKAKTVGKFNSLDLPAEYKEPIQQLTSKVDGLNLNTGDLKLPAVEIPGYSLPDIGPLGDITGKAGEIGKLGEIGTLPGIDTPVGELGEVTGQLKNYQEDLKNIAGGDLDQVKGLPKVAEQKAAEYAGVDALQKEAGVLDEYKGQLDALKDPATGKEKAVEMAKKVAIDHFAGKEEKLKAAMEQMAKYKQKYSSVQSIKDLPKRPPNPMKGKPFIERLVPGLYFQYQQRYYRLFDFNPYLSYKLSGRFTAGAGWNHRIAYNRRRHEWSDVGAVWGPRAFVDFKLGRGFIAHVESELMNAFVPSVIGGNPEVGHREWVWGMMTGMKKEYKIWKNLRGTVLLQYNLFNREFKAPYADRLNSRIGFEYGFRKRKKK